VNSLILRTATRFLQPLLFLYSIFLLFYGHQIPGGGFTGGLVASAAFVLHAISYDVSSARKILRIDPHVLIGTGLLLSLGSGILSFQNDMPYLTGTWKKIPIPGLGFIDIGTPLIFDIGVYVLILGTTLTIFLHLMEE